MRSKRIVKDQRLSVLQDCQFVINLQGVYVQQALVNFGEATWTIGVRTRVRWDRGTFSDS